MAASANTTNFILYIVDAILFIYGLYAIRCAASMKESGTPAEWLVSKEEQKRLKNAVGFCSIMAPKLRQFGIICIIYAAYAVFERLVLNIKVAQIVGILVFIVLMFRFVSDLQKTRKDFISF